MSNKILSVEWNAFGQKTVIGKLCWDRCKRRAVFTYCPADEDMCSVPRLVPDGFQPRYAPRPQLASGHAFEYFHGLHGVFNDSLPDGWGQLLVDRLLRREGTLPDSLTPVERLMYVGENGPGALTYRPTSLLVEDSRKPVLDELDRLAAESVDILNGQPSKMLDRLVTMNGSSSGARPKVNIRLDDQGRLSADGGLWLVKFSSMNADNRFTGALENIYAHLQREAGIRVADTRLLESDTSAGWFATRRFDREGEQRLHVITMSGLLEATHRLPSVSYEDMMEAVIRSTNSSAEAAEFFRRAVFNVLAHNHDDHVKNHALMQDREGNWSLTPSYDVTFSTSFGNEHMADLNNKGRPGVKDLIEFGNRYDIQRPELVVERTRDILSAFPAMARETGVPGEDLSLMVRNIPGLGKG